MENENGKAPAIKFDSQKPDYGNIGVPAEAVGYDIEAMQVKPALNGKGNANYTGGLEKKYGRENQL